MKKIFSKNLNQSTSWKVLRPHFPTLVRSRGSGVQGLEPQTMAKTSLFLLVESWLLSDHFISPQAAPAPPPHHHLWPYLSPSFSFAQSQASPACLDQRSAPIRSENRSSCSFSATRGRRFSVEMALGAGARLREPQTLGKGADARRPRRDVLAPSSPLPD